MRVAEQYFWCVGVRGEYMRKWEWMNWSVWSLTVVTGFVTAEKLR